MKKNKSFISKLKPDNYAKRKLLYTSILLSIAACISYTVTRSIYELMPFGILILLIFNIYTMNKISRVSRMLGLLLSALFASLNVYQLYKISFLYIPVIYVYALILITLSYVLAVFVFNNSNKDTLREYKIFKIIRRDIDRIFKFFKKGEK